MSEKKDKFSHDSSENQVYEALNEFFKRYLVERNAERMLELVSEQLYSVGTGEGEIAIGKDAFARLIETEFSQLPGPIFYTIADYVQNERIPGCWDCFCNIDTRISVSGGTEALYRIRLTAGLHWDGERCLIDTLHASEASKYQEDGEFFPLKFIFHGVESLSRETRYELMEMVGEIMPGGILGGYIEDGFPLYVANQKLLSMAGYTSYKEFEADIKGMIVNCVHPDDRAYVNGAMDKICALGDQYEIEYRMKKKDGSYFWVHDIGRRTVAADGRDVIVSVLSDVSRQVQDRVCLEYEAISDPLTGVYNRKGGEIRIGAAMDQVSSYLFFMLDLDNFKQINDLYGHKQGDEVLCFVAKQLTETFRKTDVVCRLGGDEFAVFVAGCDDIQAIQRKVQRVIDACCKMMEERWPAAQSGLSVGGVCGARKRSFAELYQLADEALYQVKNTQKGRQKFLVLE